MMGLVKNAHRIIFNRRSKPLTRSQLHEALDQKIGKWVRNTCTWRPGWHIGDYRLVVFDIQIDTNVSVYVQLWSEPLEPVLCEVSSGKWNPPADVWLAGERSNRIRGLGFEIGGRADNFQREFPAKSLTDLRRLTRTIVDILYAGFDYTGMQPLRVVADAGSRTTPALTLNSVTPEDVAKAFAARSYSMQSKVDDEDAHVLRLITRGTVTTVHLIDRVPDNNLFRTAIASCELPPVDESFAELADVVDKLHVEPDVRRMVLQFDGGVTEEWLSNRIDNWTGMLVEHQREVRKARKALRGKAVQGVH
jgi:hypothetical protein